ncbi:MAG: tRNA lysidine(34) synthetase TilS [Anaerovoracaceae bacterium]
MKNKTLQIIKKYGLIERDSHIIVGLSGGPDSVCLFDVLFRIAEENPQLNWKIYAVHVNHKLREGAAEEDQRYVEELCAARKVPCRVAVTDCKALAAELGMTSEEAGRKARYDAFSEEALRIQRGCKSAGNCETCPKPVPKEKIVIALAHNANDQCETILFRLMRGSGTDGLAGIAHKRQDQNGFSVVRPILDFSRAEIEKYCEERNLSPRIDHTNSENTYTRNKIRNMLIPFLEENFNENITETVNRLGKIASCDRDFLRQTAAEEYEAAQAELCSKENINRQSFNIEKLKNLHKSIRTRIYTMALERIGIEENITFSKLEAVDELLDAKSPSASVDLSAEFKAAREYDRLTFIKINAGKTAKNKWRFREMSRAEYEEYKKEGRLHGAFSGVDMKKLVIRTRREGDRIDIGRGTKKLQDFFVDEKLPKNCRDEVEVLAAGSDILWVMPSEAYSRPVMKEKGRFSAACKVKEDLSESVIVLERL